MSQSNPLSPSKWRTGWGQSKCDKERRVRGLLHPGFQDRGRAMSQGMWASLGAGKGEASLLEPPEKADFTPLRHLTPPPL